MRASLLSQGVDWNEKLHSDIHYRVAQVGLTTDGTRIVGWLVGGWNGDWSDGRSVEKIPCAPAT